MKKLILSLFIVSAACNFATAGDDTKEQKSKLVLKDDSGTKCFNENTKVLNVGVGFGSARYYSIYRGAGYSYGSSPAFSLTYEQAIHKKLGPGYLGVGAYTGYQSAHARYDNFYYSGGRYYYEHKWKNFLVAARAAYHLDFLNSDRAEVYAGVLAGVRIQTYSYTTNNPDPAYNNYYRLNDGSVYPVYSLFAGARWYFVPNIAVFGEVGYGISYGTIGFSFKL